MTEEQKRKQWFVVHVLAGQEMKVRDNLVKRMRTEEMGDFVYEVVLPMERIAEVKRGKKTETNRKFFPGYLIVNMWLFDDPRDNDRQPLVDKTWYFIKDTPGVIGFAGTKDRPIPMRESEVQALLSQVREREENVIPKISFSIGETVKVADGPFENQSGVVEEIDPERGKLRVSVSIFGRNTLVDLEYWQVERA
ncbi:MAG: transcriptional antiterminator NusG [Verrucomicrobia bacterium]|jgi:transcription termination/antitermination protein NusG|nr:MAG: transcriptional antiterminator NusG [Verrucomicrobiota bacterium]